MLNLKNNNSLVKKIFFIFILAILLQIPMLFISFIVNDRDNTYYRMLSQIESEWGRKQVIGGAFLIIPYEKNIIDDSLYKINYHVILPDTVKTHVKLNEEVKQRGIYTTTVYTADITIEGKFPSLYKTIPDYLTGNDIYAALHIEDTPALIKVSEFTVNGENIELESGTGMPRGISTGISGKIPFRSQDLSFKIKITLRGNGGIEVLPFGKQNIFTAESSWNSPSFYGVLPNRKEIGENGFKAEWDVSNFVRNYKQSFSTDGSIQGLEEGIMGIKLYEGVTHYRQVERAIKYSMLFIILSLFCVYIFEILSKRFTHYVQYGVIGFSLTLFYLTLLSLSEYFTFGIAYIIAALALIIPNALYMKAVTQSRKFGAGMFVFLSALYAVLFSILKMEQYALITGSFLLLAALYIIMYFTKQIELTDKEQTFKFDKEK